VLGDETAAVGMIFISGARLRELVPMRDAISAVRIAFEKVSNGRIEQPTRLVAAGGAAVAMLALDSDSGNSVVKALTVRPDNPGAGRPAVQAVVIYFDGRTGTPEAVLDGTSLTALRTGAAAGVATDLMADPKARVLAVIGAGGQCADQVRAVCSVRPIAEVRIASRTYENSVDVAKRLQDEFPKLKFSAATTNTQAATGADVICTVTGASQPLFGEEGLASNVHINAMGAFTPTMCELPPEVLRKACVVAVDELEAAEAEAGDLLQAVAGGYLKWADVVELGAIARGLRPRAGWTVFKSVGIGAQDLEVAELAVSRARVGTPSESTP
jgi:ornithine cyclodeaminase